MAANGYFNLWILGHFTDYNRLYLDCSILILEVYITPDLPCRLRIAQEV